jgi:hypothetical protein
MSSAGGEAPEDRPRPSGHAGTASVFICGSNPCLLSGGQARNGASREASARGTVPTNRAATLCNGQGSAAGGWRARSWQPRPPRCIFDKSRSYPMQPSGGRCRWVARAAVPAEASQWRVFGKSRSYPMQPSGGRCRWVARAAVPAEAPQWRVFGKSRSYPMQPSGSRCRQVGRGRASRGLPVARFWQIAQLPYATVREPMSAGGARSCQPRPPSGAFSANRAATLCNRPGADAGRWGAVVPAEAPRWAIAFGIRIIGGLPWPDSEPPRRPGAKKNGDREGSGDGLEPSEPWRLGGSFGRQIRICRRPISTWSVPTL